MGEQDIQDQPGTDDLRTFMRALLEDVRALETMIERGLFETGRRIGAEQEMFLVDRAQRPVNRALAVLERLQPSESFTTELGLFNLECNLAPLDLGGDCLSGMERELDEHLRAVRGAAEAEGVGVVLTGILPTLEKRHLGLESMTPNPRFYQLNHVMRELRGGEFRTYIKGADELQTTHDNVMLEACNTSFQIHFQVSPEEFAKLYNVAQVVTGPVLAAAVNSPLLLRHRLWKETRVALFQQSLDTRSVAHTARGGRMRVSFGDDWVRESVLEIFKEDVARFRVLVATELDESPLEMLERGEIPSLKALRLHNGTVYRWNRPCYGVAGNKPHLRIENRVLPAGPSVVDEVANAALFFGLMCALADEHEDVTKIMPFDNARENFIAAARYGLGAQFEWIGGKTYRAEDLLLHDLLPLARAGLRQRSIDEADIDRYMGVLEERVKSGRTGARWALDSLEGMSEGNRSHDNMRALTAAMGDNQLTARPVHEWPLAVAGGAEEARESYRYISQIMTTDLFTVHPEDLVDLAASVMDWEHLRHVPVEDAEGSLVGLVTHRHLLRMVSSGPRDGRPMAVREIMTPSPLTADPNMSCRDAIALMRRNRVGCLPVVNDGRLVGIVTESDFMQVASQLLDRWLSE